MDEWDKHEASLSAPLALYKSQSIEKSTIIDYSFATG